MRRVTPAIVAAFAVLFAGGCLPAISLRTGHPIGDNQVRAIAPGTTTKTELLEWFGAPAAIAACGEVVAVATPATWAAPYRRPGSYGVDAGTFCELFPTAGERDRYHRVYYYRHVVSRKTNFFMLLAVYERGGTSSDSLWAVVNEKTGIVEDYAFKKSGALVVFGRPRTAVSR